MRRLEMVTFDHKISPPAHAKQVSAVLTKSTFRANEGIGIVEDGDHVYLCWPNGAWLKVPAVNATMYPYKSEPWPFPEPEPEVMAAPSPASITEALMQTIPDAATDDLPAMVDPPKQRKKAG